MSWLIAAGIWLACGYLGAGWWYGYLVREFPMLSEICRDRNTFQFWRSFILGPAALLPVAIVPRWRKHGRLYPWTSTRWRR